MILFRSQIVFDLFLKIIDTIQTTLDIDIVQISQRIFVQIYHYHTIKD